MVTSREAAKRTNAAVKDCACMRGIGFWRLLRGGDVRGFDAHVNALAAGLAEATEQKDDQSNHKHPANNDAKMELAFPDSTAITLLLLTLFFERGAWSKSSTWGLRHAIGLTLSTSRACEVQT
jgi:hypothetical protein